MKRRGFFLTIFGALGLFGLKRARGGSRLDGEAELTEQQAIENARSLLVEVANNNLTTYPNDPVPLSRPIPGKTRSEVDQFPVRTNTATHNGKSVWFVLIELPDGRTFTTWTPVSPLNLVPVPNDAITY